MGGVEPLEGSDLALEAGDQRRIVIRAERPEGGRERVPVKEDQPLRGRRRDAPRPGVAVGDERALGDGRPVELRRQPRGERRGDERRRRRPLDRRRGDDDAGGKRGEQRRAAGGEDQPSREDGVDQGRIVTLITAGVRGDKE
jgi:hypothetical protein